MAQEAIQYEISHPPSDGISSVEFFNYSNYLVVSSWDKSVSLYNLNDKSDSNLNESSKQNDELSHRYFHRAGVLDVSISPDDLTVYSVGCDNRLYALDVKSSQHEVIGQHNEPIRCVEYCNAANMIITGSWDKTLKMWDQRQSSNNASYNLPDKCFAMSCVQTSYRLIVGVAGRQIYIYDIRNMKAPEQTRESSLKHQTRNIVAHPNCEQFVVSSIEGRVAVEYFDPSPDIQCKKYAFKCHRVMDKTSGTQTIYPVNAITFHPTYKTFATGGGDGVVNIWDGDNKKRICQFAAYPTSISSLDFNYDGSILAISASYTWEHGHKANVPKDSVWIRRIKQSETKPKIKVKKHN